MNTYVCLLRGIMPGNPNMKSEKLKNAFEAMGFKKVATVIGSGNVIFASSSKDTAKLEATIEKALPELLGFKRAAIVRSRDELETLAKKNPFKGIKDEKSTYLVVSFFKDRRTELCTVIDLSKGKTPNFMAKLEKDHGKEVTTRTWKTVLRILKKMEEMQA